MAKTNDNTFIVMHEAEFEKIYYIKNDPKQKEYILTGITIRPGGSRTMHLDYMGDEIEVFENEITETRNELKYIEGKYAPDQDEDD